MSADQFVEQLIALTERLTVCMTAETRAFEAKRPAAVTEGLAETGRLANLYRHETMRVKSDPSVLAGASPALKVRLRKATESFEAMLQRHQRALYGAKVVTEGVVKAIAEEIARTRAQAAGYGPGARLASAGAGPIALNRQA
ncbi:MAG: flagellar basal body protein [Caulobacteraceae bacterium]